MATPAKYTTLTQGEDFVVKTALGETGELRLCAVPGRLAIEFLMAAGNEDPQTVVALAAGVPPEELDWIAIEELDRLQEAAIDLNFSGCAAVADSRAVAAKRMLPVLRKAGKKAIDMAMDTLLHEWEGSMKSKLPSLKSTIERAQSSEKTPASSSKPSPSAASANDSATPENGPSKPPS